ncbi:hypothetical protein EV426DRAFT_533014 [Tirmania nivea]|nr:hypothetical protein EV426DRAFT_533014 [Tirmania nivea]
MEVPPIRSFYCVYLLRSLANRRSTYVGSTPDPRRRLAQHNGEATGGACRTSKNSLKPWEMVCVVTGFPSRLAALQFEWAWAHASRTTKIPKRECPAGTTIAKCSKKPKRRNRRTPSSLPDRLRQLDVLLRVRSFLRWPVAVRFFVEDVWDKWKEQRCTIVKCGEEPRRTNIAFILDLKLPEMEEEEVKDGKRRLVKRKKRQHAQNGVGGLQGLDITYDSIQPCLQKINNLLSARNKCDLLRCMICESELHHPHETTVVCPHAFCEHISHITCLSAEFLGQEAFKAANADDESQQGDHALVPIETQVLPVDGSCPSCGKSTQWIDIVKPLTYRLRVKVPEKKTKAAKVVTKGLKIARPRKKKAVFVDDQMEHEESFVLEEDLDQEKVLEYKDDRGSTETVSNSDIRDIENWL